MYGYFRELIRERRRQPRSDLISALASVEEKGDVLSEEELLGLCNQLLTAGHDTTRDLIGSGMLALLQNTDQLQKLRDNPSLVSSAVEELLRYDSPLQRHTRVAKEDLEVHGKQIRKNQSVLAMLGAANRDLVQFADPNSLDVSRKNNGHVAFGAGLHYCLGAPLSRFEGQIAISMIVQRCPTIWLATEQLQWRQNMSVRGFESLPCRL